MNMYFFKKDTQISVFDSVIMEMQSKGPGTLGDGFV